MVPIITKTIQKISARAVTTGAIFACSVLAGTALSQVAAQHGLGGYCSPVVYAAEGTLISTDPLQEYDVETAGRTVTLTKPLRMRNLVQENFDGDKVWQTVPDVIFEYRVAYDLFGVDNEATKLNDNGIGYRTDTVLTRYMAVAKGVDSNGTKFDIYRGPYGGITVQDEVRFSHDDEVDADSKEMVTKKITVKLAGGDDASGKDYFKRPGVYRYPLEEVGMKEVDFDSEADMVANNVTGYDPQGERVIDFYTDVDKDEGHDAPADIQYRKAEADGTYTYTDEATKELRFLDLYIEWDETETGFVIKDVVLHDITAKLDYEKDGDFALGDKPEDPGKYSGKQTGFSESLYTTQDLVIAKEVMGKGLTDYDITEREFQFDFLVTGPAYTQIRYEVPARTKDAQVGYATMDERGVATLTFTLHHGEYALISGMPEGCRYNVEETDHKENGADVDEKAGKPKMSDVFQTYYAIRVRDAEEKKMVLTATGSLNLLADEGARNVEMMRRQAVYETTLLDGGVEKAESAASLVKGRRLEAGLIHNMTLDNADAKRSAWSAEVNNVVFLNHRQDAVVTGVQKNVAPFLVMVAVAAFSCVLIVKRNRDELADE